MDCLQGKTDAEDKRPTMADRLRVREIGYEKNCPGTVEEAVNLLILVLDQRTLCGIANIDDPERSVLPRWEVLWRREYYPGASEAAMRKRAWHLLSGLHFSLGMWIRNNFGLWHEHSELIKDCARRRHIPSRSTMHPNSASHIILMALWERLIGLGQGGTVSGDAIEALKRDLGGCVDSSSKEKSAAHCQPRLYESS